MKALLNDIKAAILLLKLYESIENNTDDYPSDESTDIHMAIVEHGYGSDDEPFNFDNNRIPDVTWQSSEFDCKAFYESINYDHNFFDYNPEN
jgi:hypothetical protein